MILANADITFTDASPMALAMLTYQMPAPVDNDYLRVALLYGVADVTAASSALHGWLATINF